MRCLFLLKLTSVHEASTDRLFAFSVPHAKDEKVSWNGRGSQCPENGAKGDQGRQIVGEARSD